MKIISFEDIENLKLPYHLFYDWAKEALLLKKTSVLPPKTSLKCYGGEGFVNVMPAILPNEGVYGVKVVSRNPESIPVLKSKIMLYELENSKLISLIDADFITAFRTAGCAVVAIETLANKDYEKICLIGLGNICRATMLVLLSLRKNKKFHIKIYLYNGTDNGMIDFLSTFENVILEKCNTIKEAIQDSDVIISCVTYAADDLALPEWFKSGCLLVPIHTRGFLNCDLIFDRVIVDDFGHTNGFKNFKFFKNCSELSEVLVNKKLGRSSESERIIAYNVGIALLDIFFANKIALNFKDNYSLKEIEEKLWVKK